eukprot:SAG11_NODE_411_length_9696_cov_46.841513_3_plen_139_part_00
MWRKLASSKRFVSQATVKKAEDEFRYNLQRLPSAQRSKYEAQLKQRLADATSAAAKYDVLKDKATPGEKKKMAQIARRRSVSEGPSEILSSVQRRQHRHDEGDHTEGQIPAAFEVTFELAGPVGLVWAQVSHRTGCAK